MNWDSSQACLAKEDERYVTTCSQTGSSEYKLIRVDNGVNTTNWLPIYLVNGARKCATLHKVWCLKAPTKVTRRYSKLAKIYTEAEGLACSEKLLTVATWSSQMDHDSVHLHLDIYYMHVLPWGMHGIDSKQHIWPCSGIDSFVAFTSWLHTLAALFLVCGHVLCYVCRRGSLLCCLTRVNWSWADA